MKQLLNEIEHALARADQLGDIDAGIHLDRARIAVAAKLEDPQITRRIQPDHLELQ